jgi:hypothetical protein
VDIIDLRTPRLSMMEPSGSDPGCIKWALHIGWIRRITAPGPTRIVPRKRRPTSKVDSAGVPRSATTTRKVNSGFSAIRANSHSRSRFSCSGRHPPIRLAAALPLVRQRCDPSPRWRRSPQTALRCRRPTGTTRPPPNQPHDPADPVLSLGFSDSMIACGNASRTSAGRTTTGSSL